MSRLASGETLSQLDHTQIAKQLASGDSDSGATILLPDWSGVRTVDPSVRLVAVTTGKGVNALAHGQRLTFGSEGLTVVYGDNGSGKSGYARLLKEVVGARVHEDVLSNIFIDQATTRPAAEIVFSIGGVETGPHEWLQAPPELEQIGFFDESCGDAYVTTASEVTFRPAELFVLGGLIEACDEIHGALDLLWEENNSRSAPLPIMSPDGSAAQFLAKLSGSTEPAEIDQACQVDSSVGAKIDGLKEEEAKIKSSNPARERSRLDDLAGRYQLVANHLQMLREKLGPEVAADVAERRRLAAEIRAAATIAAQASFEGEPVVGVGSDTWRVLWEAARRFSETEAYVGETYPVTGPPAKCVLCHQDLDDDARSRLERFEASMRDETEQGALAAVGEANAALSRVQAIEVVPANVLAAVELLRPDDPELASQGLASLEEFVAVAEAIVGDEAVRAAGPTPSEDVESALRSKAVKLRTAASQVSDSQYQQQLGDIADELARLEDCALMGAARAAILGEVSRLREKERIEEARRQTNTATITRKSTELTRAFVTSQVRERFTDEARRLRLERVVLEDVGGQKGRLRNKPAFDRAVQNPSLDKVLSEGEQRALGLAGFFTEASLDESRSALVLDDPVSSLDHVHRELVASRLAEFATDRQVVIFTHDLAFVSELYQATTQAETPFVERSVELRGDGTPGACVESHPWKAKSVTTRFGELEGDLTRLKKIFETGTQEERVREIADWAGKLSETWERIIRATVTSPLFDPGTQHVSPKMFRLLVNIKSHDNHEFQESYGRVSRWARRHDKSVETNPVPPRIDELEAELQLVRVWFDRVRGYRN